MNARHYRSSSVRGALAQARHELGPAALVNGTRLVPSAGWRGWLGGREVELSASAPTVVSENRPVTTERPVAVEAEAPPRPSRPIADGLVARLVAAGLDQDLAEDTVKQLPANSRRDPTQGQLRAALAACVAPLAAPTPVAGPIDVFIGPPGVGKTTTIAKLAAQARATGAQRFGLIAADGYRVGAVEQLRLYAEIIGSPFVVTRTPDEVAAAASASRLPVLVDTPGISPANEEAAAFFAAVSNLAGVTTHLVIPAATSERDFDRIWARFEAAQPTRVVITKLDEAETAMPLVRRLRQRQVPISLLGLGQQVPQDLSRATADTVAACLLGQVHRTEAE